MIDGVNSKTDGSVQYATKSNSDLDKDAFLKLMLAQLQNQDPLEPLDGTDYSAQLAQFSSLEQMQNINESLNMSLDANFLLTQSINNTMTASMIGQEVKIAGNTIKNEGQDKAVIGYDLLANAHEIKVNIYDSHNVLVKTYEDLDTDAGQYKLSWDFTDDNGNDVSVGDYRVEIEAKTLGLKDMEVPQYLVGQIGAVRFSADNTTIVVNDIEYDISEIFEVIGSSNSSEGDQVAQNDEQDEDN